MQQRCINHTKHYLSDQWRVYPHYRSCIVMHSTFYLCILTKHRFINSVFLQGAPVPPPAKPAPAAPAQEKPAPPAGPPPSSFAQVAEKPPSRPASGASDAAKESLTTISPFSSTDVQNGLDSKGVYRYSTSFLLDLREGCIQPPEDIEAETWNALAMSATADRPGGPMGKIATMHHAGGPA